MSYLRPRFVFAAVALAASMIASPLSALAADYSAPPPPEPELRRSDWTGPYLGGVGAVACMETSYATPSGDFGDLNGCDLAGGVVAGWNHQLGNWVLGVEGDFMWGGPDASVGFDQNVDFEVNHLGTIRGRVGWLATDETLLYATGGVGWLTGTFDALVGPNSLPASDKHTHFGWLVGGGIEHAFTSNFHARLEYLYGRFKEKTYDVTVATCAPTCVVDVDVDDLHMVRLGLTWNFTGLFDTPAPVIDAPVYKP